MKRTTIKCALAAVIVLSSPAVVFPGTAGLSGDAGIRGVYSLVDEMESISLRPFVRLGYDWKYVGIEGEYCLYPHEPLSPAVNPEIALTSIRYQYIFMNDFTTEIHVKPVRQFGINGKITMGLGKSGYRMLGGGAGIGIYLDPVSLTVDYDYEKMEFVYEKFTRLGNLTIQNTSHNASVVLAADIIAEVSLDLSYNYYRVSSDIFEAVFDKNNLRLGVTGIPVESLAISAGIGYGFDSNDFKIIEADAGIIFKADRHLEFNLLYNFSSMIYRGDNPNGMFASLRRWYMNLSLRTNLQSSFESYYTHMLLAGVTFSM